MSATTPGIDRYVPVAHVLRSDAARDAIESEAPGLASGNEAEAFAGFPLGIFLQLTLRARPDVVTRILERLGDIPNPVPLPSVESLAAVSDDYEDAGIPRASSRFETLPGSTDAFSEIVIHGPSHGNPFVDVDVVAEFRSDRTVLRAGGFYDGDGTYRIRLLPPEPGTCTFTIRSNARSMDGLTGELEVSAGEGAGPVHATSDGFARASGAAFTPFGTTAYAWTHQGEDVQRRTLAALAAAPFNKLRMGLFPKSFIYNSNEPERFVFPRREDGSWDLERFDLRYFRHLEGRVRDLAALGIEADLILFHPYDRWGFSALGATVDDLYVRYAVRRLAAFGNVWWSMANEYELLTAKRPEDWERLGRLVEAEDHVGHPRSIHNIVEPWDAASSWVTHCSIQLSDPSIGDRVAEWRERWGKPVVVDEMGYEGDLDQGWGCLTGEEMLLRFWQVMLRGGYATHGETFWSADEEIFWAKGGDLVGESIPRIAFLRSLVEESPTGRLDPLPSQFDAAWAGAAGRYVLIHFGRGRPRLRDVPIPTGHRASIDVIDAWNMTVETVPGVHRGTVRVDLPARQHIVIRLRLEAE
jgi:hypothetical protein